MEVPIHFNNVRMIKKIVYFELINELIYHFIFRNC